MKNTGGPAFPGEGLSVQNGMLGNRKTPGMELRDYFAGQALSSGLCPENAYCYADMTEWAYKVADNMLIERDKQ